MGSHQCRAEGKGHLPPSATNAFPNAAQEAVGLCRRAALMAHAQLLVLSAGGPQGPSLQSCSLAGRPPARCPQGGWIPGCPPAGTFSAAPCPSWTAASPLSQGPTQGCRVTWDSKPLSCRGCTAQACCSRALGTAAFALLVATSFLILLPPAIPSSMPLLGSKALPPRGRVCGYQVSTGQVCPWPRCRIGGAAAQMCTKAHNRGHREQEPRAPSQSWDIRGRRAEAGKDSSHGFCGGWRYRACRRDRRGR